MADIQNTLRTNEARTKNPLGNFSSYTYQITLYMVTPSAYDAFIASGRTNINAIRNATPETLATIETLGQGAFIIAQSGGVNTQSKGSSDVRANSFNLDYYIDNLRIKTATSGHATQSATNVTDCSFNIIEPYGFSFITNLKRASDYLTERNALIPGYEKVVNSARQFFILGIRFLGYDKDGNVINNVNQLQGKDYDPTFNNGVFERFYDIIITEIKFRLDGKSTTYDIKAATVAPATGFGLKRGRIFGTQNVQATTVGEALTKLEQVLNDKAKSDNNEMPNEYYFKFIGKEEEFNKIKNASLLSKADRDKSKSGMKTSTTAAEVNDVTNSATAPDLTKKIVQFNGGTSILDALTQLIGQSSYLENALSIIRKSNEETDNQDQSKDKVKNKNNNTISWYNVSAEVKPKGWNSKLGDWAFVITYIIQPYLTPVVNSVYANKTIRYYGPHKKYDYWFTGKNSEILSYEQSYNNVYFNVALDPDAQFGTPNTNYLKNFIPQNSSMQVEASKLGKIGQGMQAQGSYITSLYDPETQTKCKISILGDPDFLIQDSSSSINSLYQQLYGPGGTINANGGQVFIEIKFNEAKDYNVDKDGEVFNDGLLTVNDKIFFWKYPQNLTTGDNKLIDGVVYQVLEVSSNFSGGKFTQDISATISTLFDSETPTNTEQGRENQSQAETNRLKASGNQSVNPIQDPKQNVAVLNVTTPSPTLITGTDPDLPPI